MAPLVSPEKIARVRRTNLEDHPALAGIPVVTNCWNIHFAGNNTLSSELTSPNRGFAPRTDKFAVRNRRQSDTLRKASRLARDFLKQSDNGDPVRYKKLGMVSKSLGRGAKLG